MTHVGLLHSRRSVVPKGLVSNSDIMYLPLM